MVSHAATTTKPFKEALAELLRENDYTTQTGNINWHSFARELDGVHYETLRKILADQRSLTKHVCEEIARVLRIKPTYFAEYRIMLASEQFDVREVGFDAALANLERWSATAAAEKTRSRRRA